MSTKKNSTRFLALFLSLMMVIGFLPTGVFANGGEQETKSGTTYVLDTDGVDIGAKYLIVAANEAYTLYHEGNAIHAQPVTVSADGQTATINDNESAATWMFSGSTGGTITNGNRWLQPKKTEWNSYNHGWNLVSSQEHFADWSILEISHGNYAVSARVEYGGCLFTCYLNYDGDPYPDCDPGHGFGLNFCPSAVRLYKQQNPDPCAADKQTVEFWITNSKVYSDGNRSKVSITIPASQASAESGLDVADLVPSTGTCSDNGHEVDFWKTVLLDSEHEQTSDAKDDETANGTEFQYIRCFNNQWAYSANGSTWTPIVSEDQLVAYYLEKIQLDDEVQVKMKDWGFTNQNQYSGDCAIAYQVVDPESELPLAEAAMFYNYWSNRSVGLLFISENGVYDIYKVTSIAGTYMSAAFHWSGTESLQWQGEMDGSLVIDSSKSPYTDLAWSDDANAILIRIYVKKKCPATDNLAVNYFVKGVADSFYHSSITVAAGTLFGALGAGPDSNGYYALPEGYYAGSQPISSALSGLTGLDNQLNDISCSFLGATLSDGSKTLNLYYEQNMQVVQFVAGTGGSFYAVEKTQYANIVRGTTWGDAGIVVPSPVADNDCHFTGWTCNNLPVTLPYANSFQITLNLAFTANFEPDAKIPLTVTANDHSWVYDGAEHHDGGFTVSCSGEPVTPTGGEYILPNGDKATASVIGGVKNASDTLAGNNAVTSVTVSRNGVDVTDKYMVTKVAGQLAVTAKPVIITVNNAEKEYGAPDPTFTGTVSGLVGSDSLSESYYRENASSDKAVGSYTGVLKATCPINGNYSVEVIPGSFMIKANTTAIVVTAVDGSKVYNGTALINGGFTLMYGGTAVTADTDGKYFLPTGDEITVTVSGSATNVSDTHAGNNAVSYVLQNAGSYTNVQKVDGTLTITAKPVTITVNNASKIYGQSDPVFTGSVGALVAAGDLGTVSYVRMNASVNAVGIYSDVLSATYTQNPNYTVTIKAGTFTVYSSNDDDDDDDIDIPDNPTPIGPFLNKVDHCAYIVGRGNNGVQPQAPITRAEAATIFFRMLTDDSRALCWSQTNAYSDVPATAWYSNAVSTLTYAGVINGYEDGTFRPDAPITRAEFATMATRFYDAVTNYAADTFTDIATHWARNYINRAAELSLINGYSDGTFHPADNITRAEAMTIMNAVLGRTPNKDHLLAGMITWTDNTDPNVWYYLAVQEATNSHDYEMSKDGAYEIWTKIQPARNWTELEQLWSAANSGAVAAD